ncbi:MAG TPA: hypothetical protein PLR25_03670 [Planctomycetaceae bacterium]|nr:hypothetical protein [Planctomycetaceae bacterium]
MSTSILHRPCEDVDDQTGEAGVLAKGVSSHANDIDCQHSGLDDHCLAYEDDQSVDDTALEAVSRFYQRPATDLVLDGWRLTPAQAVSRSDVHVVAMASNIEVSR